MPRTANAALNVAVLCYWGHHFFKGAMTDIQEIITTGVRPLVRTRAHISISKWLG